MSRIMLEKTMRRLPMNTTLVGEIKQFLPIPEGSPIQLGLVELMNGTVGFLSPTWNVFQS